MGRTRELTPRQEKLIDGVLAGKSQTAAAIDAGYPAQSAPWAASRTLGDVTVRARLLARLQADGIGPERISGKIQQLLDAKQYGLSRDGNAVELGPDAHAQNKTLDILLKVTGSYPDPRLEIDARMQGAIVVLRPEDMLGSDPFSEVIDVTPKDG